MGWAPPVDKKAAEADILLELLKDAQAPVGDWFDGNMDIEDLLQEARVMCDISVD